MTADEAEAAASLLLEKVEALSPVTGPELLAELEPDELARYKQIIDDQWAREAKLWWVQAALAIASAATLLYLVYAWMGGTITGFWPVLLVLLISWGIGYWPYRKAQTRRLWHTHQVAVAAEMTRRAGARPQASTAKTPAVVTTQDMSERHT